METAYTACRVYMHAWTPGDVMRSGRHYVQTLYCTRCTSLKVQWIHARTGAVERTAYRYAEGYARRGRGRMTADERGALRLGLVDL